VATAPSLELAPEMGEPTGMDDNELASLCSAHEASSVGYYNSEIADAQARAINYYYGRMDDLPALDGCSSVVDHMTAIMVDNALAAVLKPFVSADEVVSFEPRHPEDIEQAEQATEYVNFVINNDNPGFILFHNWFKDALLTKIGVVKCWWEDQSKNVVEKRSVDDLGLLAARADPNYLAEENHAEGVHTVHMNRHDPDGRVKIEGVPPEEFLISPFARSIETAPYVAHRPSNFTRSDLIEMGVDREIAEDLPAASGSMTNETRSQARYSDEAFSSANNQTIGNMNDKSRDAIAVLDEYVRVDYDGDGIAELRRVVRVGDIILLNEPVEEAPFALLCPCPMPHKVYGRSTADQALEGQKVSTAILRQTLDNLYKTNNPRPVIGERGIGVSTMDDLGDASPGAVIRAADATQLTWMTVPFTAEHSFPMLEYVAGNVEEQTGVQRKGNGLNADVLKKNSPDTATQAAIEENSRNERAEMIARIFAETGVKRLFKLVLGLLCLHQPKERIIRLRNKFVPMDPSGWDAEMDLSISVGLGVGNKAEQIAQAQAVLQTMQELAVTPYAYLLTPENVHAAVTRLFTATGIKNVDDYIGDPKEQQAPPPQPNPEMMKIQMQMEAQQHSQQLAAQKADHDRAMAELKGQNDIAMAAHKAELARATAESQASLAQQKADFEARLALQQSAQQFELDKAKMAIEAAKANHAAGLAEDAANAKKFREGGDLSK